MLEKAREHPQNTGRSEERPKKKTQQKKTHALDRTAEFNRMASSHAKGVCHHALKLARWPLNH